MLEDRKRLKILPVSGVFLEDLFKTMSIELLGLPEDASLQGWFFDFDSYVLKLKYHSSTFEPVPEAVLIPCIEAITTDTHEIIIRKKQDAQV